MIYTGDIVMINGKGPYKVHSFSFDWNISSRVWVTVDGVIGEYHCKINDIETFEVIESHQPQKVKINQ